MKIDDIRRWLQGEQVSGLPESWKKRRLLEARSALVDVLQQQENAKRFAEGDEVYVKEVSCPHCHGHGKILTSRHARKKGVEEWAVCPKCRGAGTISELAWKGKSEVFPDMPQRRVAPGVHIAVPAEGIPLVPEWDEFSPFKVEFRGWPQMYLAMDANANAIDKHGSIRFRLEPALHIHAKELYDALAGERRDVFLYHRDGSTYIMRKALATRVNVEMTAEGEQILEVNFLFEEWETKSAEA
jgi:hypothetical protein